MKFLKGLYRDSALLDQPQSTHRDALNMIMNLDKGSISTEYSTNITNSSAAIEATFPKVLGPSKIRRVIVGSVLLPDNKFLLFYYQKYNNTTDKKSASFIYLFDPEGDQMTLLLATSADLQSEYYSLETGDLNFSPEYPVTGEARVAANGDVIVYFTDNYKDIKKDGPSGIEYIDSYNPPRVFNITRQLNNLKSGATPLNLYTYNSVDKFSGVGKNVNYLNLFLTTRKIPQIKSHTLIKGGILESGAYYMCLAYATEEYTETNVYTVSQPVYIPKGNYLENGITPAVPFEHMSGIPANTQTSFGIKWTYSTRNGNALYGDTSDFDRDYPYIVPYVIKVSGTTRTAYKLPTIPTETFGDLVFTGNENYALSSVENIVLDKATYLTAKTITQLDNKMYLGNLTARKDIGYQRFSNAIKVVPVKKQIKRFDARVYDVFNINNGYTEILKKDSTNGAYNQEFLDYKLISNFYNPRQLSSIYDGDSDFFTLVNSQYTGATPKSLMGGYRNQYTASYLKSYRRGEVYALYISFVLNDGTETYAYHIPGRSQALLNATNFVDNTQFALSEATGRTTDPVYPYLSLGEEDYNGTIRYSSVVNVDLEERLGEYKYPKVFDTSKEVISDRDILDDTHSMGYWENENEYYPDTNDFKIFDVDANGNSVDTGNILNVGSNYGGVRHHKFPSNLNPNFGFINFDRTNLYRINIPVSGSTPNGNIQQSLLVNLRTASSGWNDQPNQSAFFYETINILGFQLKNIKIPKFILKQIQGFKVYYAKRTLENKTVIGQTLINPGLHRAHGFFATNRFSAYKKARGPFVKYWSFYGNVTDVLSADVNAFIQYNTRYTGKYVYNSQSAITDTDTYLGAPIVKCNDFTMLRKKTNIDIVDYISLQGMIVMHQFSGGFRNASMVNTVTSTTQNGNYNITDLSGYEYFYTGQNENEEFSWVHADLGNLDSKIPIVDIADTGSTTFGQFTKWVPNRGIHRLYTNVMIAARYCAYGEAAFTSYENSTESFTNYYRPRRLANVFTVTNNGGSYIDGLSYLKVTEADAFHGAQYLDNYAGESGIVFSVKTGLPRLLGHVTSTSETIQSSSYDKSSTYGDNNTSTLGGGILTAANPNKVDEGNSALARGKANIFLANLNSYKTDVFNPFDNQQLVWTGYYHPCQITSQSLEDGSVGGLVGCEQVVNYTLTEDSNSAFTIENIVDDTITIDAANANKFSEFGIQPFDINGNGFLNNTSYTVFVSFDPIPTGPYSIDGYASIAINGGTPVFFNPADAGSMTLQVPAGSNSSNTLVMQIGNANYTGNITLSMTVGGCQDIYDPAYLATTFQNTDNNEDILNTYAQNNNYYTGLTSAWIFGGDTFICRYAYRSTSMDFPNYYITQNVTKNPSTSNVTSISAGFGSQMSLPEAIYTDVTPLTINEPYNNYLGAVAFANQRVLRTYGPDIWPNIGLSSFNLLDDFLLVRSTPNPLSANLGSSENVLKLDNFFERTAPIAYSTLYSFFVESDDNINFRHAGDVVKGVGKEKSLFFDSYNAAEIVFRSPMIDLSHSDHLLYEEHYSALQDIKTTVPFPKKGEIETSFPSRVIRSNVQDGRIDDNYRSFLALQYKDFSQNKGAITNLVALNGLLFIHTEKSLYKTTGKQNLQLGDSTEAYIGSGDIFAQEPMELITSAEGHGGSFNKHSSIISKYGYSYVSRKEKKVFLLTDKLTEISQQGMENWFRLNIPYTLEALNENNPYPLNLDSIPYLNLDAPTGSFGFVSTYDPLFKRFIISKRELVPSDILKLLFENFDFSVLNGNFESLSECLTDFELGTYSNPYGTGVSAINATSNIISNYMGVVGNAAMWFDPRLGMYIFNSEMGEILEENEITDWGTHVTPITLPVWGETSEDCAEQQFFGISIINDNYWFKESGWTVSYYPDNQSWVSRHSYVSPWYFYNSEYFFSFESYLNNPNPKHFIIWKHNNPVASIFYGTQYPYEFEFIINDSPDLTKVLSSVNFIADVYTKNESGSTILNPGTQVNYLKDKLTAYNIELPFSSFYIYNTYQNSGYINFEYLNNIRRVEGSWMFNNFRDLVTYTQNSQLSDNQYNISGAFNNNVQAPLNTLMFLGEGIINPAIIDNTKPWFEQKKFTDKFFAVRLIGQGNNNLVNLYSANATLRKSSR